ncbi:MAG: SGNH/GDSL hydrolase family protein [Verrucomicrobia bacterium]|nr:SGNH/GDSL hydrolase family protein [Verrucomicrobiota bacterium]
MIVALAVSVAAGCTAKPAFDTTSCIEETARQSPARFVKLLEASQPQAIVAYGTSLTEFGQWVHLLESELNLKFPGPAVIVNSGKGGISSDWGAENLDDRVLAKKPDAVLIEFAINDAYQENAMSVGESAANLAQMIDRIRSTDSNTEIILLNMNPPTGRALKNRPHIDQYLDVYRSTAKRTNLRLIDLTASWRRMIEQQPRAWKHFVPDGLHPSEEASRKVILPCLLRALGVGDTDAVAILNPLDPQLLPPHEPTFGFQIPTNNGGLKCAFHPLQATGDERPFSFDFIEDRISP